MATPDASSDQRKWLKASIIIDFSDFVSCSKHTSVELLWHHSCTETICITETNTCFSASCDASAPQEEDDQQCCRMSVKFSHLYKDRQSSLTLSPSHSAEDMSALSCHFLPPFQSGQAQRSSEYRDEDATKAWKGKIFWRMLEKTAALFGLLMLVQQRCFSEWQHL